jgi:hypothetical protein
MQNQVLIRKSIEDSSSCSSKVDVGMRRVVVGEKVELSCIVNLEEDISLSYLVPISSSFGFPPNFSPWSSHSYLILLI